MERPQAPEKPESDDCCGSGSCYQCVWDVYYEKRAAWREAIRVYEADMAGNINKPQESKTEHNKRDS